MLLLMMLGEKTGYQQQEDRGLWAFLKTLLQLMGSLMLCCQ
jgi:hypothetical protein